MQPALPIFRRPICSERMFAHTTCKQPETTCVGLTDLAVKGVIYQRCWIIFLFIWQNDPAMRYILYCARPVFIKKNCEQSKLLLITLV